MWKKVIEYKDVNPKSPTYGSLSSVSEVSLDCFRPAPAPMWVLIGESCEYDEYGLRTGNMLREFQDENETSPTYGQISSTTEPSEECEASTTDPVWVNTGENWCEQDETGAYTGYLVIEQYDKNPFSPNYMETREIKELSEDCTASDKNPHWVTLQEQCVIVMVNCNLSFNGTSSKFQIDDNPFSPTYNTTRMITEQSESCVPCGEEMYRWVEVQGEYICVGTTKCKKMKKQVSYDRGYSWSDVIPYEYQAGDAIETHSTDCGYVPPTPEPIYRWVDDGDNFICSGTTKCERLKKQVSIDSGSTWSDIEPAEYSAGTVIEYDSTDCGYVPDPIYRWVTDGDNYICDYETHTKYQQEKKQVSLDSGSTWSDVVPKEVRAGVVIEYDSPDCGYVPPMVIYKYEYVDDVCGSDERLEDAIEGVSGTVLVQDDYLCVGYDKYEKEEVVLDFSGIVYNTGEYVVGDLISGDSFDCGYIDGDYKAVCAYHYWDGDFNVNIPWHNTTVLTSGETNIYPTEYPLREHTYAVNIASGCTEIGDGAFYIFPSLGRVYIPDTVTRIGNNAFKVCWNLPKIDIPDNVTSIGSSAFTDCQSLSSITIPSGVTTIGDCTFENCFNLTSVTMTDNVTSIGASAFTSCISLKNITIPSGVSVINEYTFNDNGLYDLHIPSSVTSISTTSFINSRRLTGITVDSNNSVYDSRNNCNAIIETSSNTLVVGCVNTVLPSSVTKIGASAFRGCVLLTGITIPDTVTRISGSAFYQCSAMTSVGIGSGVTSIGFNPFANCSSLTSITVDSNNSVYDSRDNCNAIIKTSNNTLVVGCKNTVIPNSVTSISANSFWECTSLSSIAIPDSVTTIGGDAFYSCYNLTSVTIGSGVTTIQSRAFVFCNKLSSITCTKRTAPTLGGTSGADYTYPFYGLPTNGTLYVPTGATGYNNWTSHLPSGWSISYI